MSEPMPVDIRELYMLIGEREVIRYKQQEVIEKLSTQITEMSEIITQLREENGRLVKSTDNDPI